jgi:tripartite-type tricarboxylate transporter receptor subunit TctC
VIPQEAPAQAFPSRAITLVVPFGPGGNPDIVARAVQPGMAASLGVPVVVENRPGAGGNVGAALVFNAKADGHTILLGTINILTINKWIYQQMQFDPLALAPITRLGSSPNVLMVNPTVNAASVQDLIGLAKQKQGALSYASPGIGTSLHLSGELFNSMAGTSITHVPYKSGPESLSDLLAGRVEISFENILTAAKLHNEGRLRALAVTSITRHPLLPNVPTLDEAGLKGFETIAWLGLVAPPGTPKEVIARLHRAAEAVLRDQTVGERLRGLGFTTSGETPEQFMAYISGESEKWRRVVEQGGIKAN